MIGHSFYIIAISVITIVVWYSAHFCRNMYRIWKENINRLLKTRKDIMFFIETELLNMQKEIYKLQEDKKRLEEHLYEIKVEIERIKQMHKTKDTNSNPAPKKRGRPRKN